MKRLSSISRFPQCRERESPHRVKLFSSVFLVWQFIPEFSNEQPQNSQPQNNQQRNDQPETDQIDKDDEKQGQHRQARVPRSAGVRNPSPMAREKVRQGFRVFRRGGQASVAVACEQSLITKGIREKLVAERQRQSLGG